MPGLTLHTSNHLETLADQLADRISAAPLPVMEPEVILVQSMGMERWLAMRLATRFQTCANVRFPFPNTFVDEVLAGLLPQPLETLDYSPAVLTWRIMKVLPSLVDERGFEDIRGYLGSSEPSLKLYQLSRRLADLFDQYSLFRPEWLLAWQQNRPAGLPDSTDEAWQASLWRTLVAGTTLRHRAELRRMLITGAAKLKPPAGALPSRVSVFGVSYMPPFHLEALAVISRFTDVDIYVVNPCAELWDYITSIKEEIRLATTGAVVDVDDLHLEHGNPLLASMGRHGRDFFRLLHGIDLLEAEPQFEEPDSASMLGRVQADIMTLNGPSAEPQPTSADDRSIRIASCHSEMREVEALRDHLLDLLDSTPGLTCRDILVTAPDIERYAPLVAAVFGAAPGGEPALPHSIADRTLQSSRTVADFLGLLEMHRGRFQASTVLRLLESPAVRLRFVLSEEDVVIIRRWVAKLAIRWGMDAADRGRHHLPATNENTWQAGVDRLLLGYALHSDRELREGILPFCEVEGGSADVLDRFLSFLETLTTTVRQMVEPRPVDAWCATARGALGSLFAFDVDEQSDERRVVTALRDVGAAAAQAGFDRPVGCEVLLDVLRQRVLRSGMEHGYLGGGITFCSMLPMRSIPFKVVCLLGLNDGAFPRPDIAASFDLMSRRRRPGDRCGRDDDRYLFLEALLSARSNFYISYCGQSARDNSEAPPSVCVLELRDYLMRRFCQRPPTGGSSAPDFVCVKHHLQPFNTAYFLPQGSAQGCFSFSREGLAAARLVSQGAAAVRPTFFSTALAVQPVTQVTVDELVRFFRHPVRAFMQKGLGLRIARFDETDEDSEAFDVSGLAAYQLAEYLSTCISDGASGDELYARARAAGMLPHGSFGKAAFEQLAAGVGRFVAVLRQRNPSGRLEERPIDLSLDGISITGTVPAAPAGGTLLGRFAAVKGRDLVRAWLYHLLLTAQAGTSGPLVSTVVGRDSDGSPGVTEIGPVTNPLAELSALAQLYVAGQSAPLPFFPDTSYAFAMSFSAPELKSGAIEQARRVWEGGRQRDGERVDPYIAQCFGQELPLGEAFESAALTVYRPILEHLRGGDA
jgi:exodeoxyribonuclease V gamma subunit